MSELTIHIGLHKTGTSYLQRVVFPRLEQLHFALGWDRLASIILEAGKEEKILISDERLSGRFTGGKWLEEYEKNIENIHRYLDDPAIIIGFRRHDAMLLSLYKQYLQQGGTAPAERFFNLGESDTIVKSEDLLFERRLKYLDDRFSRIFVYTQEEMRDRLPRLTDDLARFLGVPAPPRGEVTESRKNVSVRGEFQVRLLRRLNRINSMLEKIPWLPSLDNGLFKRLHITPRRLTQKRLSALESSPATLPPALQSYLEKEYEGDWEYVMQWTENRMER